MAPSPPGPRPQPRRPPALGAAQTIEDQIRFAYFTPNPAAYAPSNTHSQHLAEPKRFGKISSSQHPPSALEHEARTRAFVPGAGSYEQGAHFQLPEGGRLNRNPPVERFQMDEYPQPAPGAYGVPNDPSRKVGFSGKFNKTPKVSKFIEDEVVRTRQVPGPGGYDVMEAMEANKPFCPEGGRLLGMGKPAGYFDVAPKLTEQNPDPGAYDLPEANRGKGAVGKLTYRYESATIEETRGIVHRAMGGSEDAPGPGAYTIPEPPPINSVPVLKGRTLPHAMPHPFAYNCAPDHARKYVDLAPVRSHNSADMIFGIGTRRGAKSAKSSRPSSGGGDQLQELPSSLGLIEEIKEEGHVEWKSGGFQPIKKSRSAPLVKAEHPVVAEASRKYPNLCRANGRANRAFLPNASRRSETVHTHDSSEENQRLQHGKWRLASVAQGIKHATSAALLPLDEEKLKQDAQRALCDKAMERMRLEGVSKQQQEALLAEMRGAFQERVRMSSQEALGVEGSLDDPSAVLS